MAEDTGEVLRRSLDAVDRHRKRLVAGLVLLAGLLVVTFIVGARAAHAEGGTVEAVLAHFFLLIIWVTALALVIVLQITVMTKRILRAIELASRRT
jgi:cation transporter-like permease